MMCKLPSSPSEEVGSVSGKPKTPKTNELPPPRAVVKTTKKKVSSLVIVLWIHMAKHKNVSKDFLIQGLIVVPRIRPFSISTEGASNKQCSKQMWLHKTRGSLVVSVSILLPPSVDQAVKTGGSPQNGVLCLHRLWGHSQLSGKGLKGLCPPRPLVLS